MIEQVRARVADLLGQLDGVVGLQRTTAGTAPYLFRQGDDLSLLELQPRYPLSLIISLIHKQHPEVNIGVVARACDIRALVEMAKRQQIDPARLHILAVACSPSEVEECYCSAPMPRLDDWPKAEMIGTPAEGSAPNPIVAEYRNTSMEERREFWQQQFLKCIKCYGCRNICPVCFCESCALEDPLWVEPGVLGPPFPMYHLIKAMHMSGRCVDCHQCELTCPSHIPLTILYELIRQDVKELLDYVPGMDLAAEPPLALALKDGQLIADSE